MAKSINTKKGIQSCYYAGPNGIQKIDAYTDDHLYLNINRNHRFYIDIETDNLGDGTANRRATADAAKWAYILAYLYTTASKINGEEVYPHWGITTQKDAQPLVSCMGIGKQYQLGDSIELSMKNKESYWLGSSYIMEVFNNEPGKGLRFSFMFVDKPKIRFTYFDKQELNSLDTFNEGYYHYGQTINLYMSTHVLPVKPSKFYNFEIESNYEDLIVTVVLLDTQKKIITSVEPLVNEKPLSKYNKEQSGGNISFEFPIYIDPVWRDTIHPESEYNKGYSAQVKITNKKTGRVYVNSPEYSILQKISDDGTTTESFEVSTLFYVKYERTDEIIKKLEREKTNQIQYIGDINYTIREFDPCGYSTITIKEGERKYDIFNEKELTVSDKTNTFFDIIRPDIDPKVESKPVEIIVSNLKTDGVACQSILLDKNQKHSDIHHVFNMGNIWISKQVFILQKQQRQVDEDRPSKKDNLTVPQPIDARIDKQKTLPPKPDGNYGSSQHEYEEDKNHKGQTGLAKKDYDLKNVIKVKGAGALNWKDGHDYKLKKEGEVGTIELKRLYYIYNKDAFSTGKVTDDTTSFFWHFRYFWLSDALAQHYFIPVSTCRYPNQLAQIRVFPDIKWEVYVFITADTPESYSHINMPSEHAVFKKHQNKARSAGIKSKVFEKRYSAEFHVKSSTNGYVTDMGVDIEKKVKTVLEVISFLKDQLDTISHRKSAQKGNAQKMLPKVGKTLGGKVPVFLEFSFPTLKVGGGWQYEYETAKTSKVNQTGNLYISLDPLIKAKGGIDLIAAAHYIPVVSPVLTALDYVQTGVEWVSKWSGVQASFELWFNLYAKGELRGKIDVDFINPKDAKFEFTGAVYIGLELGFKIKATVEKIIFTGDDKGSEEGKEIKIVGMEGQLSAEAESGMEFIGTGAFEYATGSYLQLKASFTGITLKLVGKLTTYKKDKKKTKQFNDKFNIVPRKDELLKTNKIYVL